MLLVKRTCFVFLVFILSTKTYSGAFEDFYNEDEIEFFDTYYSSTHYYLALATYKVGKPTYIFAEKLDDKFSGAALAFVKGGPKYAVATTAKDLGKDAAIELLRNLIETPDAVAKSVGSYLMNNAVDALGENYELYHSKPLDEFTESNLITFRQNHAVVALYDASKTLWETARNYEPINEEVKTNASLVAEFAEMGGRDVPIDEVIVVSETLAALLDKYSSVKSFTFFDEFYASVEEIKKSHNVNFEFEDSEINILVYDKEYSDIKDQLLNPEQYHKNLALNFDAYLRLFYEHVESQDIVAALITMQLIHAHIDYQPYQVADVLMPRILRARLEATAQSYSIFSKLSDKRNRKRLLDGAYTSLVAQGFIDPSKVTNRNKDVVVAMALSPNNKVYQDFNERLRVNNQDSDGSAESLLQMLSEPTYFLVAFLESKRGINGRKKLPKDPSEKDIKDHILDRVNYLYARAMRRACIDPIRSIAKSSNPERFLKAGFDQNFFFECASIVGKQMFEVANLLGLQLQQLEVESIEREPSKALMESACSGTTRPDIQYHYLLAQIEFFLDKYATAVNPKHTERFDGQGREDIIDGYFAEICKSSHYSFSIDDNPVHKIRETLNSDKTQLDTVTGASGKERMSSADNRTETNGLIQLDTLIDFLQSNRLRYVSLEEAENEIVVDMRDKESRDIAIELLEKHFSENNINKELHTVDDSKLLLVKSADKLKQNKTLIDEVQAAVLLILDDVGVKTRSFSIVSGQIVLTVRSPNDLSYLLPVLKERLIYNQPSLSIRQLGPIRLSIKINNQG